MTIPLIGLEHAGFIGFQLVPVDNAKVLLVECQPSPSPVFLKFGQEEEFYISGSAPKAAGCPPVKWSPT